MLRVARLLAGVALLLAAGFVLPQVVDERGGAAAAVIGGVVLALALGLVLVSRSYASAVAGAHVSRDSHWVRVPRAHANFAARYQPGWSSTLG